MDIMYTPPFNMVTICTLIIVKCRKKMEQYKFWISRSGVSLSEMPKHDPTLYSFISIQEICLAAYRGVIQPDTEDKRIISAQWAKDDDIARFLR